MKNILKDLRDRRLNTERSIKQHERSIQNCSERITSLMASLDEYDRAIELLEKDGK